jgi:hypothetical protein
MNIQLRTGRMGSGRFFHELCAVHADIGNTTQYSCDMHFGFGDIDCGEKNIIGYHGQQTVGDIIGRQLRIALLYQPGAFLRKFRTTQSKVEPFDSSCTFLTIVARSAVATGFMRKPFMPMALARC